MVPVVIYVIAGLAAGGTLLLKPWKWEAFQKNPPIKQVAALQTQLNASQAKVTTLQTQLDTARDQDKADLKAQVGYSEEMVHGARVTLQKAAMSPETALASNLLARADNGLTVAIGALPVSQQQEIEQIVNDELSAVQAQVDAANKQLAEKDAQLNQVTGQRDILSKQIPVLTTQLTTATSQRDANETQYQQKVGEVTTWVKAKEKSDSITQAFIRTCGVFKDILILLAIGWVFCAFILPALGGTFEPLVWLKDVAGYILSPLTHHDQKKQIVALKASDPSDLTA